jgi:uncharacterized membrane protein
VPKALITARRVGFLLAASGAAHFARPQAFVPLTSQAFPKDTESWVMKNGAAEAGIGLALMGRKTRKLGLIGLLGYVGFLGYKGATAATAQR